MKRIREIIDNVRMKLILGQQRETYKGYMFAAYCKNIVDEKQQTEIRDYEEILNKMMEVAHIETREEAATTYLFVRTFYRA